MRFDLRSIDRHFADFIGRESAGKSSGISFFASLVSNATGQGHVCLDLRTVAGTEIIVDGNQYTVKPLDSLLPELQDPLVIGAPGDFRPLVLDGAGRLYLHRYWKYENELAMILLNMAMESMPFCEVKLREGLARLFQGNADAEVDWQAVAAASAVRKRFCIISGGPGTGKTSTVVKILALLLEQYPDSQLRIALAAPTGKAAARLKESITKMKDNLSCSEEIRQKIPTSVSTIHRLLGTIRGSVRFRYSRDNPMPHDLVVIDEASMVDLPLISKLVTALKPDARLILLGDRDQLASVEAGAVLGDLCGGGRTESFSTGFCQSLERLTGLSIPDCLRTEAPVPLTDTLVVLKKNFRFQASSQIGLLANSVKTGNSARSISILTDYTATGVAWHDLPSADALKRTLEEVVIEGYRLYLAAQTVEEALSLFDSFRVLCALRDGIYGVSGVTAVIEEMLAENGLIDRRSSWYKGRPILITSNDYSMKLFNGDVGIVFPDVEAGGMPRVFFPESDGGVKKVLPVRLPEHQTVYAMTVHKSQGSEFNKVLMLLPDHDSPALTRELIYTGITRAKGEVEIWGNKEAFISATTRTTGRKSGLMDALWPPLKKR